MRRKCNKEKIIREIKAKTLTLDRTRTSELAKTEADKTPPEMRVLEKGKTTLANAGERVDDSLSLLRAEHDAYRKSLGPTRLLSYSIAKFGMYLAIYVLCGFADIMQFCWIMICFMGILSDVSSPTLAAMIKPG